MALTVTNLVLVGLTLIAAAASAVAIVGLRESLSSRRVGPGRRAGDGEGGGEASGSGAAEASNARFSSIGLGAGGRGRWFFGGLGGVSLVVAAGCAGLMGLRMTGSVGRGGDGGWNPLTAHVDGLLLIGMLLAGLGWFIQRRPKLAGMSAFYLPLLTLILAWAVCASAWTYRPFGVDTLHPVWQAVHLAGVYLGTLGSGVAAVAGAMYLFVERQFKAKTNPTALMRVASLERLERLIIQSATLGFALLTLGLVSGVVILWDRRDLPAGWWASPKVLLATAAWGVYAVVMSVRTATVFRGRRAAWLAIGGLVLLLGVYGIVTGGGGFRVPEKVEGAGAVEVEGAADELGRRSDTAPGSGGAGSAAQGCGGVA